MCTKLRKPALNDNFSKDFKEQVYLCDSEAGILRRRLATSRPLGERASEPFLAAKRPTASDEVARGRLVSIAGFSLAFRAKMMGSGVTRI